MQNQYSRYLLTIAKLLGLLSLCLWYIPAIGQAFVYVDTDSLILRDRPENAYLVLAILHTPCKLKLEKYEDGYKNNEKIKAKFYEVALNYWDERKYHHYISGWVEKRYVVTARNEINSPVDDTGLNLHASIVKLIPSAGDDAHNPNKLNWADFPGPKYKGGVNAPPPFKRIYHKGPKGGCYYLSAKGLKVYVNKSFCKGK